MHSLKVKPVLHNTGGIPIETQSLYHTPASGQYSGAD